MKENFEENITKDNNLFLNTGLTKAQCKEIKRQAKQTKKQNRLNTKQQNKENREKVKQQKKEIKEQIKQTKKQLKSENKNTNINQNNEDKEENQTTKIQERQYRKIEKQIKKVEKKKLKQERRQQRKERRQQKREIKQKKWQEKHKGENRELPPFTNGEEIFNAVTHIVGGAIGIVILAVLLFFSIKSQSFLAILSSCIYGISAILLYAISSIYHFLNKNKAKKVFRTLDHCTIFLLIAGSYTPICLVAMHNLGGYIMLGVVWAFAILGIVFNAINMYSKVVSVLSQICYIVTGWSAVFAFGYLYGVIGFNGLAWLTCGGLAYTVGAIFFALGSKIKYFHSIFHIFCLLGTLLQFVCILYYVIL